jgi:ACT domain-containing protein
MSEQRTRGRFSRTQKIEFLRRIDAGEEKSVTDACSKMRISRTAYYRWRSEYGRQADHEHRIACLEQEIERLKTLLTVRAQTRGLRRGSRVELSMSSVE